MPETLYLLALLACPVAMAVMMRMMMRGGGQQQAAPDAAPQQAELVRLQAQIDQLQAERESRRAGAEQPTS